MRQHTIKAARSQVFNLANKITLSRIFIVIPIVILLYFQNKLFCLLATILFILGAVTDALDGHIARKEKMVTSFGKFLDPLADKLLICSLLIMFVQLGWVQAWVTIIIICRELLVTGLRAMAADQGVVIAADKYGKAKTIVQIMALIPLTLHYPWFGFDPNPLGMILLYIALILTVVSGANYLWAFHNHWLVEQKQPPAPEDEKGA